ncbi:MAG: Transport permease protein [Candidatus Poribacteria bacterium]|nr:Transport permease protein [Candidatus Poribacteria bacterium]
MKSRILSVSNKEFIEIRRDPRTLFMVLALPTVMLLIYGYAINLDIKSIKTVVYDLDKSRQSRDLIGEFLNSGYFKIVKYVDRYDDLDNQLNKGKAKLALCIPADFSRRLAHSQTATLQTIVDGSDSTSATVSIAYINQIVQQYSLGKAISTIQSKGVKLPHGLPTIDIQSRIWYNPELKSVNFIVPGMLAMIIMMLGSILTALSVVSEKENGTFEKLIITPIRSYELVIGKIMPFVILSFADVIFCLLLGKLWFKVPLKGSIPLLLCLSTLFLFSTIGLGLLISSVAKTQRVAMMAAMLTSMLPTFLLSGFVFPIESMPTVIQWITYLIPAKYYLEILRGILLKGVGIKVLMFNAVCLLVYSLFMILISASRFKKKLA